MSYHILVLSIQAQLDLLKQHENVKQNRDDNNVDTTAIQTSVKVVRETTTMTMHPNYISIS